MAGKRKKQKDSKRPFDHYEDSYVVELSSLYRKAKLQHRTLLDVVDVRFDSDGWECEDQELLNFFGYDNYKIHLWDTGDEDDGYSDETKRQREMETDTDKNLGGNFVAVTDDSDKFHSIVFMRIPKGDAEKIAAVNIALFNHELGHVDDFERSTTFRVGETLDLAAAEAYAHGFACRKLMKLGYRWPLAFYAQKLIADHLESPVESVKKAAKSIHATAEYREWCKYARAFLDEEF